MNETISELFAKYYPPRDPWAKKGDGGRVLVVSGSAEYSGSPIFNAVSALRAGADLVTVIGHPRAMNIVAAYTPEVITVALSGELGMSDVALVSEYATRAKVLVIGSGLSRGEETHRAIREIVRHVTMPTVIDAEGIHAVSEEPEILRAREVLLTPNAGEFARLSGGNVGASAGERTEQVLHVSQKLGVAIVLKGHVDVISDGAQVSENGTGIPVMAKGGFGDTLSGIAGALLARGATPFEAGKLAAYMNGRAGQMASTANGEGTLASDMFAHIPRVIQEGLHLEALT